MLLALMMLSAVALEATADPLTAAAERFTDLKTYTVTLDSRGGRSQEVIRYYYRKPGFVRMEFVKPHRGAVLVYDPHKRQVKLRPLGFLSFLVLTLAPEDRLITSSKGHTVDRSDIGALLEKVSALRALGRAEAAGRERVGGRAASRVTVVGEGGRDVDGVARYELWLDEGHGLPLRVKAYGSGGELIEEVLMDDLAIDPDLADDLFSIGP